MLARTRLAIVAVLLALVCLSGCMFVPKSQLTALKTQYQALAEQNRAQEAHIKNLENHARRLEDELLAAYRQLGTTRQAASGTGQLARPQ